MIAELLDPACRLARPHFSDHLDGEPLSAGAAFAVRMHLTFCPMCRRTYASLRATREALRALADGDPSANLEAVEVDEPEGEKR